MILLKFFYLIFINKTYCCNNSYETCDQVGDMHTIHVRYSRNFRKERTCNFVAVILFWVVFKLDDIPSAEDGRIIACYELIRNL